MVLFCETWKGCMELFSPWRGGPSGVFLKPYPTFHELFTHKNPPLVGSAIRVTVWFHWFIRPHLSNGVLTLLNKLRIISMLIVSPYKKHRDDSVNDFFIVTCCSLLDRLNLPALLRCIWENMYLCAICYQPCSRKSADFEYSPYLT